MNRQLCTATLLDGYPEFKARFDAHAAQWEGEARSLCLDFDALSDFVIDQIKAGRVEQLPRLFELIEQFMSQGDKEVQDAVATCFLENLLNATAARIPASAFVALLGPRSREFGRAWDVFSGVKTPGL